MGRHGVKKYSLLENSGKLLKKTLGFPIREKSKISQGHNNGFESF